MLISRLFAPASLDAERETRHIAAARWFTRTAVRLFVLLYITGAVLLLPAFLSDRVPRASSEDTPAATAATLEERTALGRHVVATVDSTDPAAVRSYVVTPADTLDAIAKRFSVKPETIAYNNGLATRAGLKADATLRIPSIDAAIYEVQDGDTVEAVAAKFAAEPKAVMEANRLYFEPQNFAAGKQILVPVPSATFPGFALDAVARAVPVARGNAAASGATVGPSAGIVTAPVAHRLQWPVGGVITQGYWGGHLGVDIAAPYGTAIGASDAGTVSAVGWVAIGGLRVCVAHDWGLTTCYYHTSATYVYVGQRVARGQVVAAIGMTGVTTGPHVHWEANLNGALVNPLAY